MKARVTLLACLAAFGGLAGTAFAQSRSDVAPSLIVVGDPQLHSLYGGRLLQTSPKAGLLSKVAQRNPEQNLLAEHVFMELVDRATLLPGGGATDPVIILGDGTNVACTGEFERFNTRLDQVRRSGRAVLWAPGNHDVYMMGTTNHWIPNKDGLNPDAMAAMTGKPVPQDVSFWSAPSTLDATRNWNFLCDDGKGSVPINKGQWIARYLESLEAGVELESEPAEDGAYTFRGQASEGALARDGYQVRGRWYPPKPGQTLSEATNRVYESYLVQALDLGATHRLILIDTTQCGYAPLSLKGNAGVRACVAPGQIADIKALADTGRRLVFAGHFPLKDLEADMLEAVRNAFNAGNRQWTYLSAHTHALHSVGSHVDGVGLGPSGNDYRFDVNVGSTTDWPMEAHRVVLDGSTVGVSLRDTGFSLEPYVHYERRKYKGTEVCRHVAALDALLALKDHPVGIKWTTPAVDSRCEGDLRRAQKVLAERMQELEQSMQDPAFRARALMVARSASADLGKRVDGAQVWELIP